MSLRKKLLILSILIFLGFLVILIPALLSHSSDIRHELALKFGVPKEPKVLFSPQPLTSFTIKPLSNNVIRTYFVISASSFPTSKIKNIQSSLKKQFGPFLLMEHVPSQFQNSRPAHFVLAERRTRNRGAEHTQEYVSTEMSVQQSCKTKDNGYRSKLTQNARPEYFALQRGVNVFEHQSLLPVNEDAKKHSQQSCKTKDDGYIQKAKFYYYVFGPYLEEEKAGLIAHKLEIKLKEGFYITDSSPQLGLLYSLN